MRIVCDTNVLISGVLFRGNPRQILRLTSQGRLENCISPAILQEVEDVLRRQKFHLSSTQISAILELFQQTFTLVVPNQRVSVVTQDPDDNVVLEAALAAGATHIVSGDRHLLDLGSWNQLRIVSPTQLLESIAGQGGVPEDPS